MYQHNSNNMFIIVSMSPRKLFITLPIHARKYNDSNSTNTCTKTVSKMLITPLYLLLEYWMEHGTIGLIYVNLYPQLGFMGIPGIANDGVCGDHCRGLTTCFASCLLFNDTLDCGTIITRSISKINRKDTPELARAWWRPQMETFSALLAFCAENSPGTGEFSAQKPVTRSFDVFFDLHRNKQLSKQSRGWWFETPSGSLWRQCYGARGMGYLLWVWSLI